MFRKLIPITSIAGLAIGALLLAAPARADSASIKVGVLTCNVASGWGFVVGSSRDLNCTYSATSGAVEHYSGSITKFGVDIGYTQAGVIVWGVFAPSSTVAPGALAGTYAGGTASVSIAVGLGAHALVGGFDKSIALQPLSVEGNEGLNVAAGIGAMSLTSQP